jgi:hypothetical protein
MPLVRRSHDSKRKLLYVQKLRRDEWLLLMHIAALIIAIMCSNGSSGRVICTFIAPYEGPNCETRPICVLILKVPGDRAPAIERTDRPLQVLQ